MTTRDRVLEEMGRFRAALPELQKQHAGKWVVFRGGRVESFHDTEDEAYRSGMQTFGREGGQVIAQVKSEDPRPLTAGVVFGIVSYPA